VTTIVHRPRPKVRGRRLMPAVHGNAPGLHRWPRDWRRTARRRLLAWYRRNARDLPWRRSSDPYAIWVSEIMLQQTQVATVLRYYPRFMAAFPTAGALAKANENTVLRTWEGLGYYRRARQMHAAAKGILAEHAGRFPSDIDAVRRLPGIGRYTAGAILSIAFDQRQPILEANTIRLLSRLLAFRGNSASAAGRNILWRAADDLLPTNGCGRFNQALMELGSLICTPRKPKCDCCPLAALCPTHRARLHDRIPAPRRRPAVTEIHEAAVIVVHRGKILLRQCGDAERWSGLWDFPRFAITKREGRKAEGARQIVEGVLRLTGVKITRPRHVDTLRHGVTRFRITLDCYIARRAPAAVRRHAPSDTNAKAPLRLIAPMDLHSYPLSSTGRTLAGRLDEWTDTL